MQRGAVCREGRGSRLHCAAHSSTRAVASFFFFFLFSRFCFFRSPCFVSSVIAQRKPVFAPPESAEFSILGGLGAAGQPRGRPRQRCKAGQRRGAPCGDLDGVVEGALERVDVAAAAQDALLLGAAVHPLPHVAAHVVQPVAVRLVLVHRRLRGQSDALSAAHEDGKRRRRDSFQELTVPV